MTLLFLLIYENVNLRHEMYMYVCVKCDSLMILLLMILIYEMTLVFMIMLIENDVVIDDNIDMR